MTKPTAEDVELIKAAKKGDLTTVKKAVAAGANVNARKTIGEWPKVSALHMAVAAASVDVVRFLLDSGAEVNLGDEDLSTPLEYACGHIVDPKKIEIGIVDLLLERGGRVGPTEDSTGGTPLHHAAEWGRCDVVERLLAKGADVNAMWDQGTPLEFAATDGNPVFDLLLARGADWRISRNGWTLLHACIQNRAPETARKVLRLGADPDAVYMSGDDKKTPRTMLAEARRDDASFPDLFADS
ncbi:MAG TPA: ankyrin repeat domain-containing protein [Polyangia bacterium]|nr:ankyrin repeat domain-containing protein [Polyangia bacterium]